MIQRRMRKQAKSVVVPESTAESTVWCKIYGLGMGHPPLLPQPLNLSQALNVQSTRQ